MAVEAKRGCGYRKVGGLYLVGSGIGFACDRLPIELTICPCCGHGIKQTRGFTWVDVPMLVGGNHIIGRDLNRETFATELIPCNDPKSCPLCHNVEKIGRAGLLWVGAQFYPTVDAFEFEARTLGISRRIATLPQDFKLGETWILFAHPEGIRVPTPALERRNPESLGFVEWEFKPAIFRVWKPERLERIWKESDRGSEKVAADSKRGITPVFVPDDDLDHQGGVYDKPQSRQPLFPED